jgi:activator of HSP90 ATPase
MAHIKLIEKGTTVYILEVIDYRGQQIPSFDITLGVDILKSDNDYVNYNGDLVVSEKEVEDAVIDYILHEYPEIHDYMIDYE